MICFMKKWKADIIIEACYKKIWIFNSDFFKCILWYSIIEEVRKEFINYKWYVNIPTL